jgi:hypothetical protein
MHHLCTDRTGVEVSYEGSSLALLRLRRVEKEAVGIGIKISTVVC